MLYYPKDENWKPLVAQKNNIPEELNIFLSRYEKVSVYKWRNKTTDKTMWIEDKVKECIESVGICHPDDVHEMFYRDHRNVWKLLLPKIGWIADLADVNSIGNHFCHSLSGKKIVYEDVCKMTYNSDDFQGYRHTAIDCMSNIVDYKNSKKGYVINPFPDNMPVKVKSVRMDYEEKDGAKEDHGKAGNIVEIRTYLDGDMNNFAPWNVFVISFMHLLKNSFQFDKKEVVIDKFGTKLAKIGISGYSGFGGIHTHTTFGYPGHTNMDPLYGKNNTDLLDEIFYNQNKLFELVDYEYASSDSYPDNYKKSEGHVLYGLRFKVDDSDFGYSHEIKPGKHKYVFQAPRELDKILFERNPWGLWKPPTITNKWWQWIKTHLFNQSIDYTSQNLFDYASSEIIESKRMITIAYKDEETKIVYRHKKDIPDNVKKIIVISETAYEYEFEVDSKVPDDEKGYGYYTYCGIFNNARFNRVVIKLVK